MWLLPFTNELSSIKKEPFIPERRFILSSLVINGTVCLHSRRDTTRRVLVGLGDAKGNVHQRLRTEGGSRRSPVRWQRRGVELLPRACFFDYGPYKMPIQV
mmetsp:Transcript_10094/g.61394  ORF Transcript_10094/g.61394 Transcript_10094/m.61394 type:complete len:101 (+) Transcript_10094:1191-1493(+)